MIYLLNTRRTELLVCGLPLLQMLAPQPGEGRWLSSRTKIQHQLLIILPQYQAGEDLLSPATKQKEHFY